MGTFLQKTQAGSSNNSKNSVSASLSPYRHQLGRFHDLGTRFKGRRRLPFYAMKYWSIADSKQLLTSSFIVESQKQTKSTATSHCNFEVTSVNYWHIIVVSPYHAKLLSQALTYLSGSVCKYFFTTGASVAEELCYLEWILITSIGSTQSTYKSCQLFTQTIQILIRIVIIQVQPPLNGGGYITWIGIWISVFTRIQSKLWSRLKVSCKQGSRELFAWITGGGDLHTSSGSWSIYYSSKASKANLNASAHNTAS